MGGCRTKNGVLTLDKWCFTYIVCNVVKDKENLDLRGGLMGLCSMGGLLGVSPKSHIDQELEDL